MIGLTPGAGGRPPGGMGEGALSSKPRQGLAIGHDVRKEPLVPKV